MNSYRSKFKRRLAAYISINFFVVILILVLTSSASAHRIISYSYIEGKNIVVEGVFDDGRPTKKAQIKVYDSTGEMVHQGKTNQQGIYKFKIPNQDNLKIVLEAGMGHQAVSKISKKDLPGVTNLNLDEGEQTSNNAKQDDISEFSQNQETKEATTTGISEAKLRSIIREEVSKELAPLKRNLIQLKEDKGSGVTEILGGLGYIFGLMGIALYFKEKKVKEND